MNRMQSCMVALTLLVVSVAPGYGQTVTIAKSGKQPRVALAPTGIVCVVFGQDDAVYCATSQDGGRTYSEPVRAGAVEKLMCGMRRGPQIAAAKDAVVITAIGKAGNIQCRRSEDWGKTWSDGGKVNDKDGSAKEGLHAICAGAENEVFAVWLDLRDNKTKLFGSLTTNGGKTWSKNILIYESPSGSICECCQPSVASDLKGTYYIMWRNSLKGDRDMWMATSKDGRTFLRPQKLGTGSWRLEQCPMDGGSIAVSSQGKVITVWRRERKVYLCFPGQKEDLLGDGSQPQVAMAQDRAYEVWQEKGQVVFKGPAVTGPASLGNGGFASVAANPDRPGPVIVVWEQNGSVSGAVAK